MMTAMKRAAYASLMVLAADPAVAQDSGFTWGGSLELGVDSTVASDDPTAETTDTYGVLEAALEAAITQRVTFFGAFTLESVTDPLINRQFDDMGFYVNELGLRFDLSPATLSVGKVSPAFAAAWNEAPGFYGTSLAEDYELSEVIGATLDYDLGDTGGVLSLAVFYADDTVLSDSLGTKRGRNTTAAGGAGNTGKLNNAALQWRREAGDTAWWVGARHLKAGAGDASSETGAVAGISHGFSNGFDVIAEVAHFNGFAGTGDDATYATLGGSYTAGPWSYSASLTGIDNSSTGNDRLVALGADYALANCWELGGGVGLYDIGDIKSTAVGVALVIPFGG
jgi:hypothetical protein